MIFIYFIKTNDNHTTELSIIIGVLLLVEVKVKGVVTILLLVEIKDQIKEMVKVPIVTAAREGAEEMSGNTIIIIYYKV